MAPPDANARSEQEPTETAVARRRYDRAARRYDALAWPMEILAMDRHRARLIDQVQGPLMPDALKLVVVAHPERGGKP